MGTHITFVRSTTMDKWTDEQIEKMKLGGNNNCKSFFEASPEYRADMKITEKYTSFFATQYKDKLQALCEGRTWSPSQTPRNLSSSGIETNRSINSLRSDSPSYSSGTSTPNNLNPRNDLSSSSNPTQKDRNESYFASLGVTNASRSENLPPSQGGKYVGFGSTPPVSSPSEDLSSRALPSLEDFQQNPTAALSKGWGFLSKAVGQAANVVNSNVIQPSLAKAQDPNLQAQIYSQMSTLGTTLGQVGQKGGEVLGQTLRSGGTMMRNQMGVDVGDMGASYVDKFTGQPSASGYSNPNSHDQVEDFYSEERIEDFGDHFNSSYQQSSNTMGSTTQVQETSKQKSARSTPNSNAMKLNSKKDDDWDSW